MALHNPPLEIPFFDKNGKVGREWAEWLIIAKRDKANKVENGTEGNITTLTDDGDIQDGSAALSDVTSIIDNFAELESTRIVASNGSSGLQEVDLSDWVTAGDNITITDDGDGTITVEADDATIDVNDYISGTTNEITVTDNGDGTATIEGAGSDTDFTVLTAMQAGGGGAIGIQYKTRSLTLNGGIITTVGAESGWSDI